MAIDSVTRIISGKGIIRIPDEFLKAREVFLYAQVLRENSSVYRNESINPSESFFANITFCRDDFVLQRYSMDFDNQMWEVYSSQASQNLLAQICALDNVLDSFVSFAIALGFVYTRNNSITGFPYVTFTPNIIRFKCFGSTAIVLTLSAKELVRCDPGDGEPSPPPPPPPPVSKIPPTQPAPVSPPYEGDNDGGDTVPFPLDEPETPTLPTGEECEAYLVSVRVFGLPGNPPEGEIITLEVWGVIQSFSIDPDPSLPGGVRANLTCGDLTVTACTQGQVVAFVATADPTGFNAVLESIVPSP